MSAAGSFASDLGLSEGVAPVADALAPMSCLALAERVTQLEHDGEIAIDDQERQSLVSAENFARSSANGKMPSVEEAALSSSGSEYAALVRLVISEPDRRAKLLHGQVPTINELRDVSWWQGINSDRSSIRGVSSNPGSTNGVRLFGLPRDIRFPFGFVSAELLGSNVFLPAFAHRGFDVITTKTYRLRRDEINRPSDLFDEPEIGYIQRQRFGRQSRLTFSAEENCHVAYPTSEEPSTYELGSTSPIYSASVPSVFRSEMELELGQIICSVNEGQVLLISVCADTPEEWREIVDVCGTLPENVAIELNLSQRLDAKGKMLCERPGASIEAIRAVREVVGTDVPLVAKIAYLPITAKSDSDQTLRNWFEECSGSIQGVTAINGLKVKAYAGRGSDEPFFTHQAASFLTGVGAQRFALETIAELNKLRAECRIDPQDFSLVANGGIYNFKSFARQRHAGADAVQSCSAAWVNRKLASEIFARNSEDELLQARLDRTRSGAAKAGRLMLGVGIDAKEFRGKSS